MRVLVRGHNFSYTVSRGIPLCLPGLAWREVTLNHAVPRAGGDLCMRGLVRGPIPSTTQYHVRKGVSVSWCEVLNYTVSRAGGPPACMCWCEVWGLN